MRIGNRKSRRCSQAIETQASVSSWHSWSILRPFVIYFQRDIYCGENFFNSSCWSFILRRNVLDKIWLINMVRMKLSSFWEISLLAKRILAWRETTNGNHVGVGGPMRIEWLCVWVMFSTHFDVFCDQQLKTQLFGIKKIKLFPRNILLGYLTLLKRIRQTSFLKRHAMNRCCWKEEDDH